MIHLNLDPTPVAAGGVVALTPEAPVVSLGEVRVGRRRFQVRRSTAAATGRVVEYLLDARGGAYFLEWVTSDGQVGAVSRATGQPLRSGGQDVLFEFDGDVLTVV